MRRGVVLFMWAALGCAQTLTLTANKTNVRPGDAITLTYTLSAQTNPAITALQWDQIDDAKLAVGAKTSSVPAASAKQLDCVTAPANRCVLYGGVNIVASGPLVAAPAVVAATASGTITVKLTAPVAANVLGVGVPLTVGPDLVLTILKTADLNGDGKLDTLDIQISLDQAQGRSACTADLNGDGKCDVRDLQIVVNAVVAGTPP